MASPLGGALASRSICARLSGAPSRAGKMYSLSIFVRLRPNHVPRKQRTSGQLSTSTMASAFPLGITSCRSCSRKLLFPTWRGFSPRGVKPLQTCRSATGVMYFRSAGYVGSPTRVARHPRRPVSVHLDCTCRALRAYVHLPLLCAGMLRAKFWRSDLAERPSLLRQLVCRPRTAPYDRTNESASGAPFRANALHVDEKPRAPK